GIAGAGKRAILSHTGARGGDGRTAASWARSRLRSSVALALKATVTVLEMYPGALTSMRWRASSGLRHPTNGLPATVTPSIESVAVAGVARIWTAMSAGATTDGGPGCGAGFIRRGCTSAGTSGGQAAGAGGSGDHAADVGGELAESGPRLDQTMTTAIAAAASATPARTALLVPRMLPRACGSPCATSGRWLASAPTGGVRDSLAATSATSSS